MHKSALGITAAASIAIAAPLVASWEGLSLTPYNDIVGVETVCYGQTSVEMRYYTKDECDIMLENSLPMYYEQAMAYVEVDLPITMRAAITSFSYNVGIGAFSRSTMLKKINKGDLWGACQELDRWIYAGRMRVRGLENRRRAEKQLCIAELQAPA